jgi:hypothetical protein
MLNVRAARPHYCLFGVLRVLSVATALAWLSPLPTVAGTLDTLDFQGYLKDSAGAEVTGPVTLTFRLFATSTGGSALWQESDTAQVVQGAFFVNLGASAPLPVSTLGLYTDLYLELEVSGDGQPMSPRFEMTGAISAFYARLAGDVTPASVIHPAQIVVNPALAPTGASALKITGFGDVISADGRWLGQLA